MKFEYIGQSPFPRPHYNAHQHKYWELVYNFKGRGITELDGVQYPYSEGTVILCPPGVMHSKTSEDGFEDIFLHFSGCDFLPKVYCLEDDCDGRLLMLLRVLHSTYYEKRLPSVCDALFDALMGLLRPALDSPRQNRYVQHLRNTIIQEFGNPDFQLQTAMEHIPIHADYLRRQFKKALGLTPHEYLTQLRMEYAKHLLTDERGECMDISEVAYRAGYYDPLYFSRAFRKYTGVAPSNWK